MPKATSRQGRANKYGKVYNANHNFKAETRDLELHIDHERTKNNLYHRYGLDQGWFKESFDAKEYELKRYQELYGDGQEAKNKRYEHEGHKERCKTIEEVYNGKKTAPQESIFQLDNTKSKLDPKERTQILVSSANAVITALAKEHPDNFFPLDLALHRDEGLVNGEYIGLDHIHFRCTFAVRDKDGNLVPNQSEALRQMGYELADPEKPRSRYNNELVAFSQDVRERFYREIEARGIEIDREVKNPSQKHLERQEYVIQQQTQEIEAQQIQIQEQTKTITLQQSKIEEQTKELQDTVLQLEAREREIADLRAQIHEANNQCLEAEKRRTDAENEATRQEERMRQASIKADKEEIRATKNAEIAERFAIKNIKPNKKLGKMSLDIALYQNLTSLKQWFQDLKNSPIYHPTEVAEYTRLNDQARSMKREYEQLKDDIEQEIERRVYERTTFQNTIDRNKAQKYEADYQRERADKKYLIEAFKNFLEDHNLAGAFERTTGIDLAERRNRERHK